MEKEFRINRATASGILSLMERKGLIQRSSVSHDARLKKLELTPKGRELHERHMAGLQQVECMVEQALTPPELDQVNRLFSFLPAIAAPLKIAY